MNVQGTKRRWKFHYCGFEPPKKLLALSVSHREIAIKIDKLLPKIDCWIRCRRFMHGMQGIYLYVPFQRFMSDSFPPNRLVGNLLRCAHQALSIYTPISHPKEWQDCFYNLQQFACIFKKIPDSLRNILIWMDRFQNLKQEIEECELTKQKLRKIVDKIEQAQPTNQMPSASTLKIFKVVAYMEEFFTNSSHFVTPTYTLEDPYVYLRTLQCQMKACLKVEPIRAKFLPYIVTEEVKLWLR